MKEEKPIPGVGELVPHKTFRSTKTKGIEVAKHYAEISDANWAELVRIQKQYKIDKHALVDDIFALIGDLDAVAEAHEDAPKVEEPVHSTRAAVLEPTQLELSLEDLI